MLIDIHTHKPKLSENIEIVNIAIPDALRVITTSHDGYFSVGVHPWDIITSDKNAMQTVEKCASYENVIAIGECGFDKNCKASFKLQKQFYIEHILLSEKYLKPLIIHCVGYFNELLTLKKQLKPTQKWIIHGFRGKPQLANHLIKEGCSLSFGEKFNADSVRVTPVENIFVETDESNHSVAEIYRKIADIKTIELSALNAGFLLFKKYIDKQ